MTQETNQLAKFFFYNKWWDKDHD